MYSVAEPVRLAIDDNMNARARLVEIVAQQEESYGIAVGSTLVEDRVRAPQLEAAIAAVLGRLPEQVNITESTVIQDEVDLQSCVDESMLAEKPGVAPPIQ